MIIFTDKLPDGTVIINERQTIFMFAFALAILDRNGYSDRKRDGYVRKIHPV